MQKIARREKMKRKLKNKPTNEEIDEIEGKHLRAHEDSHFYYNLISLQNQMKLKSSSTLRSRKRERTKKYRTKK